MILIDLWHTLNEYAWLLFVVGLVGILILFRKRWHQSQITAKQLADRDIAAVVLQSTPPVSVIAPAWNESEWLKQHLESFLALRYPNKELIVCAGGTDNTMEIAQQYADQPGVIVLEQQPGEGKQRALRRSFPLASGAIIFLTDADTLLTDNSFERTLAPIINDNAAATTGGSRPIKSQVDNPFVAFQWSVDRVSAMYAPEQSNGLLGRNCAILSDVLRDIGAFEDDIFSGTDYFLARQLITNGYTIKTVPDSVVETEYPTDVNSYYHKRSRWMRNLIVIGSQTGDHGSMRQGIQSGIIGVLLVTMPVSSLVFGPILLAIWLLLVIYATSSRIIYIQYVPSEYRNRLQVLQVAILSVGLDTFVWTMALLQSLVPAWRPKWR